MSSDSESSEIENLIETKSGKTIRRTKVKKHRTLKRKLRPICFGLLIIPLTLLILGVVLLLVNDESNEILVTSPPKDYRKKALLWNWTSKNNFKHTTCSFVDSQSYPIELLQRNNSQFSASIFNATAVVPMPLARLSHQYHILIMEHPPMPADRHLIKNDDLLQLYNFTVSYKLDSFIPWHRFVIKSIKDDTVHAPKLQPNWEPPIEQELSPFKRLQYERMFGNNSMLVGLAVLDAPCSQMRMDLIKSIRNHMAVMTYGECGDSSCLYGCQFLPSKFNGHEFSKFYFAFETELCVDYVTSNFYKALILDMVPVVFGGADYTRFAPPNSYIRAEDFNSTAELVEYLEHLDTHFEDFIKYFLWKEQYRLEAKPAADEICKILYEGITGEMEDRLEQSKFTAWWTDNECRSTTELIFN